MKGQSINEGDVLATYDGGEWRVSRILKVETESAIVHLMLYPTFSRKPTLDEVRNTTPFVWHVPVSLNDNPTHGEYIGNIPIVEGDVIGYADYVEATSEFSANTEGESASTFTTETLELIQKAFDRGIKHHNKKQYDEAIASYSEVLAFMTKPFPCSIVH